MNAATPETDKTAVAYLAGEIGPQDILHDMANLERFNAELIEMLGEFVDAYKDAPQRLGAGSRAYQHFSKAKALIQKAKDGR